MAINEPDPAANCLYSTVRNISADEHYFGFLPSHGKRLACGEEFSFWGDFQHWLTRMTPNERERRSFEDAIAGEAPVLVLVKSPSPHLLDATLDETKIITLNGGSFVAQDPCWGDYRANTPIRCSVGLLPFGGVQPPSFAATVAGVSFDNANAAWEWDSPDTILGPPAAPPASSLGVNVWEGLNPLFLGQCAGDRLATRPIPDNAAFGVRPLYASIGGDTGRNSISAGWGGDGIRNVAGQNDIALFENGSGPPSGEEGFTVAVHHMEENVWSAMWFKAPANYASPTYSYLYDLSDFGIPVGDHVDAICFQNVVRGDRTAVLGECGYTVEDGYGFISELGDGTGPIYLTGLTGSPLAASKCDPDVNYVVALSPLDSPPV
jgi:hypothetical protein